MGETEFPNKTRHPFAKGFCLWVGEKPLFTSAKLEKKKKKKNRDKQITPYTSPLKRLSHCRCSLQTEETAENRLRKVKVLLWRVTPPTIIVWKS
jgi:hypothetical protein